MRGHIARKGNRYYAVVYEGIDPATGKERHRWYAAGETRKGAEKVLNDIVKRMHDGDYRAPERITLGEYLTERWLPTKKAQLRPSTFASYRNNVENHVNPRIGHILLQKLQPEDLDTFYAQLLVDGRRNGKGVGSRQRLCGTSTASSARRSPTRIARAPSPATSPISPTRRRCAPSDRGR